MTTHRPEGPSQPGDGALPRPAAGSPAGAATDPAADPALERRARRSAALARQIRTVLADGPMGAEAFDDGGLGTGPRAGADDRRAPHRRAADIGTGSGGVSPLLVDLFDELVLVDVDADALGQAATTVSAAGRALGHRAPQVRTMLVDLSTQDGHARGAELAPLDVAYSVMALHHVQDVPRLLQNVAALLRPGGRVVIADLEPDGGLYHADRPSFDGHDGFTEAQMSSWLEAAGLRVDQHRTGYVDAKPVGGTVRHLPIFVTAATRPAGAL